MTREEDLELVRRVAGQARTTRDHLKAESRRVGAFAELDADDAASSSR